MPAAPRLPGAPTLPAAGPASAPARGERSVRVLAGGSPKLERARLSWGLDAGLHPEGSWEEECEPAELAGPTRAGARGWPAVLGAPGAESLADVSFTNGPDSPRELWEVHAKYTTVHFAVWATERLHSPSWEGRMDTN